jgi:RES domain-containing protein
MGARKYGGRWNFPGDSLIYTSSSRSLSVLEIIVGLPTRMIPVDCVMVEMDIPEDISSISIAALPTGWEQYPTSGITMKLGSKWMRESSTLVLNVPSCVVPSDYNFLINPHHKVAKEIQIVSVEPFIFDERLFRHT